jgi:alginate O-acetyltransferase complex protein AlgI
VLFNSAEYILLFLPLTILVYFSLNKNRYLLAAKVWLVMASLVFYAYWNVDYLSLLLFSVFFNYALGTVLGDLRQRSKKVLVFGIFVNISLLGYFKYAGFFIENLQWITGYDVGFFHIALPLAISFFTFQQIAYLVDSYRGETKEYNFINYALFVTFFPQLIAGPIVHHREMMPQFAKLRNLLPDWKNISLGVFIFSLGLFKKVMIADTLAVYANQVFDGAATLSFSDAWIGSLSYTFQLYFDFSGYSEMAIGAALLLNIRLPVNFNSPYKSSNIQEFWNRWHMTLSRWLRDYIYIPLGGNRVGEFRTMTNIFLVFLLGGLWHGAAWTFVLWGMMHGLANLGMRIIRLLNIKIHRFIAWSLTFLFVNFTWVFFRAEDIGAAQRMIKGMFAFNAIGSWSSMTIQFYWLLFSAFIVFLIPNVLEVSGYVKNHVKPKGDIKKHLFLKQIGTDLFGAAFTFKNSVVWAILISVLMIISLTKLFTVPVTEFLYFNF